MIDRPRTCRKPAAKMKSHTSTEEFFQHQVPNTPLIRRGRSFASHTTRVFTFDGRKPDSHGSDPVSSHFLSPSGPNCLRKAQRSAMSLSSLIPTNAILVSGMTCIGARIYEENDCSFQVMPEVLLACE